MNTEQAIKTGCKCYACRKVKHQSDCAVHNEPAEKTGECTCGAWKIEKMMDIEQHLACAYYETDAYEDVRFLFDELNAALRAQQEIENPQPLMLEEVQQQLNEWVWVEYIQGACDYEGQDGWMIVREYWNWAGYNEAWRAYAHEPREATP